MYIYRQSGFSDNKEEDEVLNGIKAGTISGIGTIGGFTVNELHKKKKTIDKDIKDLETALKNGLPKERAEKAIRRFKRVEYLESGLKGAGKGAGVAAASIGVAAGANAMINKKNKKKHESGD